MLSRNFLSPQNPRQHWDVGVLAYLVGKFFLKKVARNVGDVFIWIHGKGDAGKKLPQVVRHTTETKRSEAGPKAGNGE